MSICDIEGFSRGCCWVIWRTCGGWVGARGVFSSGEPERTSFLVLHIARRWMLVHRLLEWERDKLPGHRSWAVAMGGGYARTHFRQELQL
jgi:hypothetical protein